jgi:hypothetical protein
MIQNLVIDNNGETMITQTSNGLRLDMSNILSDLSSNGSRITTLEDYKIQDIKNLLDQVDHRTAYIDARIDSNNKPVVILGSSSDAFQVQITNSAINFLDNGVVVAYASNRKFYSTDMVAKNSLQLGAGPGFVWQVRSNGNMGLTYIAN